MIAGAIHRQAACILIDPYANAFQFDGSKPSPHSKDDTEMKPGVFERKWEVDSLCYCMRLAYQYWKITGDTETFDSQWKDAMRLAVATFRDQQRQNGDGAYHFKRGRDGGPNGVGSPLKPTGMICTAFRNSDDRATYQFDIPDNLFAVSSLRHLAEMADALMPGDKLASDARSLADQVDAGIKAFGIVDDPKFGKIYAYECDGLGHTLLMDDAGIPSLLAVPYLNPELAGDPLVLAARHFSLSPADPWFFQGSVAEGLGSVHTGKDKIWPMAIIAQAITSTDDAEITRCLTMLKNSTAGTGFVHESFNKDDASKFSRKWFAWVNNFYGELILKILKEPADPFQADASHFLSGMGILPMRSRRKPLTHGLEARATRMVLCATFQLAKCPYVSAIRSQNRLHDISGRMCCICLPRRDARGPSTRPRASLARSRSADCSACHKPGLPAHAQGENLADVHGRTGH